ncbi:MAG: hypothetical protein HYY02_09425 [Chloroflexi bacterium]|nr:hypothetical protein [Chloroflexota bacterium]
MGQEPGKPLLPDVQPVAFKDPSGNVQEFTGRAPADGLALPIAPDVLAAVLAFNGTTLDRWRNNQEGTLLANAARTASAASPIQTSHNARGVLIYLNITVAGTGTLTLYIRGSATMSAQLLASAATAGGGLRVYVLYPGASGTGGHIVQAVSAPLPRSWDVLMVPSDGSSWTYQVDYALIN